MHIEFRKVGNVQWEKSIPRPGITRYTGFWNGDVVGHIETGTAWGGVGTGTITVYYSQLQGTPVKEHRTLQDAKNYVEKQLEELR